MDLTVKLKTSQDFKFFLNLLHKLSVHSVIEEMSICLAINNKNYVAEDFSPSNCGTSFFPRLDSMRVLRLSTPPGTFWATQTIQFDAMQDFAVWKYSFNDVQSCKYMHSIF